MRRDDEPTVCGNGTIWLAPQPRGLLRKFDKGEKTIFFYTLEASHVIGRGFHAITFLSVALFARLVRLTKGANRPRLRRGDERSRDSKMMRESGKQCRRGPT